MAVRGRELEEQLDVWVAREIISPSQADAIRTHEATEAPSHSVAREVLAYLGAVLVGVAGFILIGQSWDNFDEVSRIVVSLIAGGVLAGAGFVLGSTDHQATRRAGQVSLLLAAAPIGFAIGMITDTIVSDEELSVLAGFTGALVFSVACYARYRSWAQHTALFLSALGTTIALGTLIEGDAGSWVIGTGVVALGVGWLIASVGDRLEPKVLGEAWGVVALGIGSIIVVASLGSTDAEGLASMVLWIAVSISLIGMGVARDQVVLLVGGVLGLLIYIPWLVTEVLGGGVGAPVALLVSGALLIGTAVHLSRRSSQR
ncbi:MAG TPA: DUF2157 domain-containing protein [Acidimicrobiia bacterium]|nr:DUF2157 domain-containing protein [Acidimicrobiia bacterium]